MKPPTLGMYVPENSDQGTSNNLGVELYVCVHSGKF